MTKSRASLGSWILAFGLVALATGCGSGTAAPPTADAGPDRQVAEDTRVVLAGTATAGSSAIASVAWTQTSGPTVSLTGADTDTPSFTAPKAPIQGTVTVDLLYTVTDTGGRTDSDSLSVLVTSDDFALFLAIKDTVGVQELYKSDVETGGVTKLSGPLVAGGNVTSFAIAPNGLFVAYRADQDTLGVTELYVARTDGSGVVKASGPLAPGGSVDSIPFWAPDSSRVAYYASQDTAGVIELYTSLPDGTGNAQVNGALVAGGAVSFFGADPWAPDSSRLLYAADQDTNGLIEAYTSLPDGTGNVKVSGAMVAGGGVPLGSSPLWSPDSAHVAYVAYQDSTTAQELYAASPLGGSSWKLNGPLVAGGNVAALGVPAWAPDASRIVYQADQDIDAVIELYSSRWDGSGNTRLHPALPVGGLVVTFAISPDSAAVAYTSNQDSGSSYELFASPIAGGGNVKLSGPLAAGGNVGAFRWAPDSSRVAYLASQDTATVNELYTSLPDGTGNVKISGALPASTNVGFSASPTTPADWAPDASLVSYVVFASGGATWQIPGHAALPDGAGSIEYTGIMDPGGTGLVNWPTWAPDASRLMYAARQDSPTVTELFLSSPEGIVNEKISGPLVAGGSVSSAAFAWSP